MSAGRTRHPRIATVLAAVCAVVLVAGIAFGVWLRDQSSEIDQESQDRAEVVQAAQRFTITWNTIDPDQADEYLEQVNALVTDGFEEKAFGGQGEEAAKVIRQGGVTSQAKVLTDGDDVPLVGISVIDPNSATALVVSDSQRTVGEQEALRHWRWQLDLVKQDGDWLVDDLSTV